MLPYVLTYKVWVTVSKCKLCRFFLFYFILFFSGLQRRQNAEFFCKELIGWKQRGVQQELQYSLYRNNFWGSVCVSTVHV